MFNFFDDREEKPFYVEVNTPTEAEKQVINHEMSTIVQGDERLAALRSIGLTKTPEKRVDIRRARRLQRARCPPANVRVHCIANSTNSGQSSEEAFLQYFRSSDDLMSTSQNQSGVFQCGCPVVTMV
jgi:hypothetical protein